MTTLSVTVAECAASVIYGVDLGDKTSDLCGLDGVTGEVLEEGRFATTKRGVALRFSRLDPVIVAFEAGTHSRWIAEQLEGYGHTVIVAHPAKVRLICDNDTKSDQLDALRLAMLARADPRLLHPIKHRGQDAHQDLALLKGRDLLVRERTRLVNFVRGMVKSAGGRLPSCAAKSFHKKVAEHVPEELRVAVKPVMDQLWALEDGINEFNALIEKQAKEKYPETQLLRQIAGVGPVTSLAFVLTLEDPHRFANGAKVGSFLGLRPRRSQTGGPEGKDPQLRITKAGNSYLRRLLVGCAQYILGPLGPDCDLKRWGTRLVKRKGNQKAAVAVARKLGVLLHRLWSTGEEYDPFRCNRRRSASSADGSLGACGQLDALEVSSSPRASDPRAT